MPYHLREACHIPGRPLHTWLERKELVRLGGTGQGICISLYHHLDYYAHRLINHLFNLSVL